MAIVKNLASNEVPGGTVGMAVDYSYVDPNREYAGDPNGNVTPYFAGDVVHDTTNKKFWQAQDLTNDSWIEAARVF